MRHWMLFMACAVLGACAHTGGPMKMYAGEAKPDADVATLLPPAGKDILVLYVDHVKTGNCTIDCSFHGPVQVLPGKHNFQSSTYDTRGVPERDATAVPRTASEGTDVSLRLDDNVYAFNFDSNLEAGKRYRLQFAVGRKEGGQSMPHAWWQEETTQ